MSRNDSGNGLFWCVLAIVCFVVLVIGGWFADRWLNWNLNYGPRVEKRIEQIEKRLEAIEQKLEEVK